MRTLPAVLLALALTTACSGGQTAAPAVPLERTAASPSPSAAPTPLTPKVGGVQVNRGTGYLSEVTALRVRRPLPALAGAELRAGYEYVGVEARVCVKENSLPEESGVSWMPWTVTMADDTVATPLGAWSPSWFSVQLYPDGKAVRAGRCVRGWIPFEVPKGARPKLVGYQPTDGQMLEWRVS